MASPSEAAPATGNGVSSPVLSPAKASHRSRSSGNTGARTYRVFRGLHELHHQAQKIAGAFDPDLGDFEDGDQSVSDSDDDSDDSATDTDDPGTDDDERPSQESDRAHEPDNNATSTPSDSPDNNNEQRQEDGLGHSGVSGSSAKLPGGYSHGRTGASVRPQSAQRPTRVSTTGAAPKTAENIPTAVTEKSGVVAIEKPMSAVPKSAPLEAEKTVTMDTNVKEPILPASSKQPVIGNAAGDTPAVVQYQIVKVRKPDGTIVKVKRPIKPVPPTTAPAEQATPVKCSSAVTTAAAGTRQPSITVEPQVRERHAESITALKAEAMVHEKEIGAESMSPTAKPAEKLVRSLPRRNTRLSQVLISTIMIVFPLLFMVLGILGAVVNGRSEDSKLGAGVVEAVQVGVSIWPIVFAAIVAQSLKMLASYKVERGLRLMTLEQLITSHSVASAIKQPFFLQTINWTSIALILLWSLSPLAGQAMLRMVNTAPANVPSPITVGFLESALYDNKVFQSDPTDNEDNIEVGVYSAEITALYSAALLDSPTARQSAQDPWGNPRIPVFEELVGSGDSNGWCNVSSTPGFNYTSLLGIPLAGVPTNGTIDFTISSYYLVFSCPFLNSSSEETIAASGSKFNKSSSGTLWLGMDPPSGGPPAKLTFASEVFFAGYSGPDPPYAYSVCDVTKSAVDSHIVCVGGNGQCEVDSMRRTPNPNTSDPRGLAANFVSSYVNLTSATGASSPSMTERFIMDPNTTTFDYFENQNGFDLSKLPLNVFNERLSIVLNTYWMTGLAPMFQSNTLPRFSYDVIVDNTTDAVFLDTSVQYATSWGWLTLLLVSSVILLLAGVAGTIWDAQTIGPDILGFANSIVRKSKYIKLPETPSTAGGAERARKMGDIKVMMQDVKPGSEVGKIALGTVSEKTERLKPGRLYK
ncbi:hypothetical protein MMC17_001095 [Xylographa soralifera]|nr:hypothetical protein [Xylographa soralifera]